VRGFSGLRLTLAGVGGVLVVGALVPVVAIVLAGGEGPVGWLVVAGAAACASGLALGATKRALPAVGLALVAVGAGALAVASASQDDDPRQLASSPREAETGDVASERSHSRGNASTAGDDRERDADRVAARFVRAYYAEVDAGRFEDAWSRLSAAAGASPGTFEAWQAGYATTVSQRVLDVRTGPGGLVRYVLVAVDQTPCGTTTERRFAVRWRLVRTGGRTTATVLGAVKLDGVDPVAAC
jgi:hypothetical protein